MEIDRYCYTGHSLIKSPAGAFVLYQDIAHGAVIVHAAELAKLMKAARILEWLEENVTHLEHGERSQEDAYWPHTPDDVDPYVNFFDCSLAEYVEKRMAGEVGKHADTDDEDEYEPYICGTCAGSGEGRWDGSTCPACKGKGEVLMRAA